MKKKLNLKAAVLGAAVMAAGACATVPAYLPSTVMAATESVEAVQSVDAAQASNIVVSRTIYLRYKNDDGTTKPVKSSDGGDFKVTMSATFQSGDTKSSVELEGYEVPSIPGYTPDKTYIKGIKVTSASNPEDVIVYYTENPEHKKTYETESETIKRSITYYKVGADGKAVQTWKKTQSATLSRVVTVYGDGRKEYSAWQSYTFPSEEIPEMDGYTASLTEVPAQTCTPDNPPTDVAVYFNQNYRVKDDASVDNFTVKFVDGFGNTLKTETVAASKSATAPAAPTRTGYVFSGWDKDFSNVRENLTVTAKWTANKTESVKEEKKVRRTISYFYNDGSPVISTTGAPATQYYEYTFSRAGLKDTVTGKITWYDWSPETVFPETTTMAVPGYTPNKSTIPSKTVDHNSDSWEVKVYYKKNDSNEPFRDTYTGVRYQDKAWRYISDGSFDSSFTGVAKSTTGNWVYVKKGIFDSSYTGIAKTTNGNWVYVKKGKFNTSFNGVARSTSGEWMYAKKGRFDPSYTGVAKSTTGNWVFVRNGIFTNTYTGVARSTTGNWVFVKKGKFTNTFTGVTQSTTGNWVYVKKGRFDSSYTGKAKDINGNTVQVKKGRLVK